jgi:hypothetical protein
VVGSGQGVSTDILEAGAHAYVRALSSAVRRRATLAATTEDGVGEPEVVRAP